VRPGRWFVIPACGHEPRCRLGDCESTTMRSNPNIDVRLKKRNELRHHGLAIYWYFIVVQVANQISALDHRYSFQLREVARALHLSWGAVALAMTVTGRHIGI